MFFFHGKAHIGVLQDKKTPGIILAPRLGVSYALPGFSSVKVCRNTRKARTVGLEYGLVDAKASQKLPSKSHGGEDGKAIQDVLLRSRKKARRWQKVRAQGKTVQADGRGRTTVCLAEQAKGFVRVGKGEGESWQGKEGLASVGREKFWQEGDAKKGQAMLYKEAGLAVEKAFSRVTAKTLLVPHPD